MHFVVSWDGLFRQVMAYSGYSHPHIRIADPSLGQRVLRRPKEFIQAPVVATVLGMFGSNVVQVCGLYSVMYPAD